MGPKRNKRVKKFSIPRSSRVLQEEVEQPPAPTPTPPPRPRLRPAPQILENRAERQSAAARIHGNRGYCRTVTELMRQHPRLQEYQPAEVSRDVFSFSRGRQRGSLIQTHVRFRFDYANIQDYLVELFTRLFALRGTNRDSFEVVITFNAILYCQDTNTYSLFYGTDHRENNRMGAAQELGYGSTFVVQNLLDVRENLTTNFNWDEVIGAHRNAFPNSNVRVFKIVNIIYLIYQVRRP